MTRPLRRPKEVVSDKVIRKTLPWRRSVGCVELPSEAAANNDPDKQDERRDCDRLCLVEVMEVDCGGRGECFINGE